MIHRRERGRVGRDRERALTLPQTAENPLQKTECKILSKKEEEAADGADWGALSIILLPRGPLASWASFCCPCCPPSSSRHTHLPRCPAGFCSQNKKGPAHGLQLGEPTCARPYTHTHTHTHKHTHTVWRARGNVSAHAHAQAQKKSGSGMRACVHARARVPKCTRRMRRRLSHLLQQLQSTQQDWMCLGLLAALPH